MATIIIKLEKKDINTSIMGCNFMVDAIGDVSLIFTPDSLELIGCTPEELKIHIEKQFTIGMSWDNYGTYGDNTWNIDHKIPLSSAKTKNDIYTLSHYTNLQPMWSKENLKKGNKIIIND